MPEIATGSNSLQERHTGAASHEAYQADPDLSLGKHISATVVQHVLAKDMSPTLGSCSMSIEYIGGMNVDEDQTPADDDLGTGTLTATSANTVTWTPPGGGAGAAVTIANGQEKLLEGSDPHKWIRVTRTSATDMSGSASVELIEPAKNVLGFDDVSSAEQSAGDNEYRCVGVKNISSVEVKDIKIKMARLGTYVNGNLVAALPASGAGTITGQAGDFDDWPDSGAVAIYNGTTQREVAYYASRTGSVLTVPAAGRAFLGTTAAAGATSDKLYAISGIALGLNAPTSQPSGTFVDNTGADEGTAPAGITFNVPVIDEDALDIGDLAAGYIYAVWGWRQIVAAATGQTWVRHTWNLLYDAA